MIPLFHTLEAAMASGIKTGTVYVGWPNLHMVYVLNEHGARFIYHREV